MSKNNLEQQIQTEIINYFHSIGFLPIKHNNIGIYSRSGVPDILVCSNKGRFIAVEVKIPGEKPSKLQQAYIDAINKLNGVGFYATSLDEVKKELKNRQII